MIHVFINNIQIIFLSVIIFVIMKKILKKIYFNFSLKWQNSWLEKFDLPDQIIWMSLVYGGLACLTTLQQTYHIINFGKEENYGNLVVGILALYGIFYTFIQFTIGYASQSGKDKHWGKSKAKALLTDNTEYRLFLSPIFKILLTFCSIYPILKINEKASNAIGVFISSIIKIEKNFLVSLWTVGIFCIYILYILLFVKSLMVMRRLFEIQEHGDYQSIRKIEYKTVKFYQNLFLEHFNNKKEYYREGNYFLEVLIDDLNAAKFDEKKVMLKVLFEKSINKYVFQQWLEIYKINDGKKLSKKVIDEYRGKSYFLADFFKELFSYIAKGKIELDVQELLSFYEIQDKVLYNQIYVFSSGNYEKIIKGIISIYEREGYSRGKDEDTLYFRVPYLIWNRVDTYEKLKKLNHYILERKGSKELLKKYYSNLENTKYTNDEKKLLDEYDYYLDGIINKCREFQDDFNKDKKLYLFKSWRYNQGNKKISRIIQDRIYYFIEDLEYNDSNKQYFEVLIRKLEYKYALAIIFYIMLYTGSDSYSKWKKDVLFLRNINRSFYDNKKINSEENINFVCSIIERSNIGHNISRKLVTWILNHINSKLTTEIIQVCNKQRYMSYAKLLKFKYIFQVYGHFSPDFLEIDLDSLHEEGWNDWRVVYLREMLETPSLLKEEFFSMYQFRLSEQVLKSCLHKYVNETEDFRLFYIDMYFSISEEQFISMTKEITFVRKGIADFLILKLDDESYEYLLLNNEVASIFIKNVKYNMNRSNKSIKNYVGELVNKANECSIIILPIITKNRIIIKLQKLIYGDYNKAVIE